jgi:Cu+-exporting ATPase
LPLDLTSAGTFIVFAINRTGASASVIATEDKIPASRAEAGRLGFSIEGMNCASCVSRVERVISAVPGVQSATVNLATERAAIAFSRELDPAALVQAIRDAGYEVGIESIDLSIDGMSCAACVNRIELAPAVL